MVVTTQPINPEQSYANDGGYNEVLAGAIRVDEQQLRGHIDEAVCSSEEETLNGLLEADADAICGAGRCERSANRADTRAGSYIR